MGTSLRSAKKNLGEAARYKRHESSTTARVVGLAGRCKLGTVGIVESAEDLNATNSSLLAG
eukprot:9211839-Pyramimonas_sp.AAC.2